MSFEIRCCAICPPTRRCSGSMHGQRTLASTSFAGTDPRTKREVIAILIELKNYSMPDVLEFLRSEGDSIPLGEGS